MLYLNDDYCYSLEDLRAFIKRCAIIGPELDNPLIKDLLCALKDGSLKEFLETGSIEEKQIAERLPDYNISKDDVELLNLLHQCFDNSYEMRKISIFDYIELISVHGKIGDGETKEFLPKQQIEVQEGITPIELEAKFKVKKHVNLQLDFYMRHEYTADTCQSTEVQDSLFEKTNNIINLKDTDDCFTVPLHIEIINTHKLGSVLSIIVGKDGYDIENIWKINVCCNSVTIPINDELSTVSYRHGLRLVLTGNNSKKTEKNIKEAEKSEEKIASLKIIDFGAKTAQVKYIISRRINISIHDAFSLDSNDIIEIHQNDVISLKNKLESLGAIVQIVDKKPDESNEVLSSVVSGVHKHSVDILRQAMENAIKVLNETKKD